MALREALELVLSWYPEAVGEPIRGHPLADYLRSEIPPLVRAALPSDDPLLIVKGSAGQGNWARGPWVAVFDRLVTETAQEGFYPVFLFPENMHGVYLNLGQAVTEAKAAYKSDAKTALRARAGNFRAMLGSDIAPFDVEAIDLAPASSSNDTAFYEAGSICSKYYPAGGVPDDDVLASDLNRLMQIYRTLINAGAADHPSEQQETPGFLEGAGQVRLHYRIERNRRLVAQVKKSKGARCEACYLDFSERYGEIGAGFIEAHHLIPFAKLQGNAMPLDPVADFAVLCSNCHRMVHKLPNPSDIAALRELIEQQANLGLA